LPALIGLIILGFIAIEARDARNSSDPISQHCEKENITDVHVRECGIRLTMQTQRDERLSLLDNERR
jgi:hypothetical protein